MKKTIVILVNYNNYQDTVEAVDSLLIQTYPIYKIIIVDNCSQNDSFQELTRYYSKAKTIEVLLSKYNGGFSYGNNFGIKYCEEKYEYDYLLLINNDTISDSKLNEEFINYYEKNYLNQEIVFTGRIYNYPEKETLWYAGDDLNKIRCGGYRKYRGEKDNEYTERIREITFPSGCLLFFPKDLIKKMGYLAEEYFMYYEDTDFAFKLKKNKIRSVYLPQAKIWHKVSASSNNNSELEKNSYFYKNRNSLIVALKYYNYFYLFIFVGLLFFKRIDNYFYNLIKNNYKNTFTGVISGFKIGIKKRIEGEQWIK